MRLPILETKPPTKGYHGAVYILKYLIFKVYKPITDHSLEIINHKCLERAFAGLQHFKSARIMEETSTSYKKGRGSWKHVQTTDFFSNLTRKSVLRYTRLNEEDQMKLFAPDLIGKRLKRAREED